MASTTHCAGAGPSCPDAAHVVHTVGHSTRPLELFARCLAGHHIELLVDIRTVPRSRRVPHFNREGIEARLAQAGYPVRYLHMPGLGGLRRSIGRLSPNGAWESDGFRGFADYMLTDEFAGALAALMRLAEQQRVAIMCAEAVPWRCHRSLVADALAVRGVAVRHLMTPGRCTPHRLTPFARVEGTRLTYPPPPQNRSDRG